MNDQPYGIPDKHWPAKLSYWWFRAARRLRLKALEKQQITDIQIEQIENLQTALDAGQGVMIAPNHSFHWDSYCLLTVADRLKTPFYVMTAWQVFSQSSRFECESMQRCGCFSVDRENTDIQSMKTAMDILQHRKEPLVVFPEGDIYHTNDRLTAIRDGAAAIALMAARKSERPIAIVPVAIKRWYTEDPTQSLSRLADKIEERLFWKPQSNKPLVDRILTIASGLLSLKEIEHLGHARQGSLPERISSLADSILKSAESKYQIPSTKPLIPERIKEIRRKIIQQRSEQGDQASEQQHREWNADMQDMFLATQLYSYPGDYLQEHPSWERQAETLDKLQEDVLGASYPSSHGRKTVSIRFGEPIAMPIGKEKKASSEGITSELQRQIQSMLDEMNLHHQKSSKS
ncbi:MAG: lysophospholipid acyltransferase family protein [Planctomycetota bacterium]|jgi:1-acyl-sn-glycerol-3-phosphate acyltransferase